MPRYVSSWNILSLLGVCVLLFEPLIGTNNIFHLPHQLSVRNSLNFQTKDECFITRNACFHEPSSSLFPRIAFSISLFLFSFEEISLSDLRREHSLPSCVYCVIPRIGEHCSICAAFFSFESNASWSLHLRPLSSSSFFVFLSAVVATHASLNNDVDNVAHTLWSCYVMITIRFVLLLFSSISSARNCDETSDSSDTEDNKGISQR